VAFKKIDFDLSGRVALITGSGQGVGRGIAHALAANGAAIAVNDYFPERAEAVAAEINENGGRAVAAPADITAPEQVDAMVARIQAELGGVDILVNNAGNAGTAGTNMPFIDFWKTTPADWDVYFQVNLFGVMNVSRACSAGMVERRHGRIITIVSDSGRVGQGGHEAYSAAKAGAQGFSRALAHGLGRHGVTVNTISLANMRTKEEPPTPEELTWIEPMLKRYIVRRQGRPADVAAAVLLLASDEASWITGQNYPVNGGYSFSL
jgi:2-hydroxycyclohexanecarboxyl-CoA dehydrogenase